MRRPGIEPGPSAWKADILTTRPTTLAKVPAIAIPNTAQLVRIAKKVENLGIDPSASRMLSERSTI